VAFKHSGVKLRDNTFLKTLSPQPYGVDVANLLELSSEMVHDGRNNAGAPTQGFYGRLAASFFPQILDSEDHFSKLQADSRLYFGGKDVTMALRAAGERVWGRFPFYEAAFLGGSKSLRGFRFQRFAGDASVIGSAELRIFLARPFILLPTDFGVFGFAETGRVWLDGNSDGAWHKDFGGGILLAPLRRDFTISIGAGVSNERTALVAGLGFSY
jgi:outer membrane protein assembly factor BamA